MWGGKKADLSYKPWESSHICLLNHVKSSGAKEGARAVEIFSCLLLLYNIVYKYYLRDGDSFSFKDAVASKPYQKFSYKPQKLWWVGHIQKRIKTRLITC